ncbi:hypothetical protein FB45DRAFT_939703 [Roridomyces roridus]|uniref:Uncharacterized protein n=1 Tax=Roridomyces roridus TaxID=1738132 RepID=A0AAD7B7U5_9AGAR|nr:hypothetical protein FB45DRAFT_939703 [Roridomyces roridus]
MSDHHPAAIPIDDSEPLDGGDKPDDAGQEPLIDGTVEHYKGQARALNRTQRAVSRVLVIKHDVSALAIARELGWSENAIYKSLSNGYRDNLRKDPDEKHLPARFAMILKKFPEAKIKVMHSDLHDSPGERCSHHSLLRQPSAPHISARRRGPNAPPATSAARMSRSPSLTSVPSTSALTTDQRYLRDFVEEHISHESRDAIYQQLHDAGFTEEMLSRVASQVSNGKATELLKEACPTMKAVHRLLFLDALEKLPVYVA